MARTRQEEIDYHTQEANKIRRPLHELEWHKGVAHGLSMEFIEDCEVCDTYRRTGDKYCRECGCKLN